MPLYLCPIDSGRTFTDYWFQRLRDSAGTYGTRSCVHCLLAAEGEEAIAIGAYINSYRPVVEDRVQALTTAFVNKGYDTVTATQQAYAHIKNIVRNNAYIMAFNDAFLVLGISLLVGAALVWLCRQTKPVAGAAAH